MGYIEQFNKLFTYTSVPDWTGPPSESTGNIDDEYTDPSNGVVYQKRNIYGTARWVQKNVLGVQNLGASPVLTYIGNSIGSGQWVGQGPLEYLCAQSNGYLIKGVNASVGGQTSEQIKNRFDTDIRNNYYDVCLIDVSTNDVILKVSLAIQRINILEMVDKVLLDGKKPVLIYPPSYALRFMEMYDTRCLLEEIATLRNIPLVDFWAPYSINGKLAFSKSDFTLNNDKTHPTNQIRWNAMKIALGQFASATQPPALPISNSDVDLVSNNLFETDSNADGYPDSWNVYSGGSYMTRIDSPWGVGKAISMTVPQEDLATGSSLGRSSFSPTLIPGHRYYVYARAYGANLGPDSFLSVGARHTKSGISVYSYPCYLNIENPGDVIVASQWLYSLGSTGGSFTVSLSSRGTGSLAYGHVKFAQLALRDMGAYQ